MVDTNALLTIAFTLISQFTNKVPVPAGSAPRDRNDVQMMMIGTPWNPMELYLDNKNGTQFRIARGVVQSFKCLDSFFDYPLPISKWSGTSLLGSNDVVRLATQTVRALIKHEDPLTNGSIRVEPAGVVYGQTIPFWRVIWPSPANRMPNIADLVIDGRTGEIVSLNLWDRGFFDLELEQQWLARFYKPDAQLAQPEHRGIIPGKRRLPPPTTQQASAAIRHWQEFCQRLGIPVPPNCSIGQVDWQKSIVSTGKLASVSVPWCRVVFTNGTLFDSLGDVVISHFSSDGLFMWDYLKRPQSEWDAHRGLINWRWEDLAQRLQDRLSREFPSAHVILAGSRAIVRNGGGTKGSIGLIRTVIEWRTFRAPEPGNPVYSQDLPLLFAAEFDLQTGELEWIDFNDLRAIGLRDASTGG